MDIFATPDAHFGHIYLVVAVTHFWTHVARVIMKCVKSKDDRKREKECFKQGVEDYYYKYWFAGCEKIGQKAQIVKTSRARDPRQGGSFIGRPVFEDAVVGHMQMADWVDSPTSRAGFSTWWDPQYLTIREKKDAKVY